MLKWAIIHDKCVLHALYTHYAAVYIQYVAKMYDLQLYGIINSHSH